MKYKLALFCMSFCLMACTQAQAPLDTFRYRELVDLPYLPPEEVAVDSLQRLNLVLPEEADTPPLLLWIGGGAWSFVNRHMEMPLARQFARQGIAVASVGHRLSKGTFSDPTRKEGVQHPTHVQDIAAAFKWLYDHADEYGYDRANIFVSGFSSGGHLAALLGMDSRYLAQQGLEVSDIKALLPVAGAYDISKYHAVFANHENPEIRPMADTHVKDVFGDTEADFVDASPTTYVDQLALPMLVISEGDLYEYTNVFEEAIWASEFRNCQFLHIFNLGHSGLWKDISNAPDSQARRAMVDFIKRHAKG